MWKETFTHEKRPLHMKRDICMWKETYVCETCICEKNPLHVWPETYKRNMYNIKTTSEMFTHTLTLSLTLSLSQCLKALGAASSDYAIGKTLILMKRQVCCSVLQLLQCVAVYCSVLKCVAVCCSMLQWLCHWQDSYPHETPGLLQCVAVVAVRCSALQCVAVFCSVLQCVAVTMPWASLLPSWIARCVAVCCSVLQCFAACCSVLQCVATWCSVLQHGAVCWSVVQYDAVCCAELYVLRCVALCGGRAMAMPYSRHYICKHKHTRTHTHRYVNISQIQGGEDP